MRPTVRDIERAVCERFKLAPEQLRGERRKRRYARPRQIAMFLCRELTGWSSCRIAHYFGRMDHTTVLYAEKRIPDLCETNAKVRMYVEDCRALIVPRQRMALIELARQPLVQVLEAAE